MNYRVAYLFLTGWLIAEVWLNNSENVVPGMVISVVLGWAVNLFANKGDIG